MGEFEYYSKVGKYSKALWLDLCKLPAHEKVRYHITRYWTFEEPIDIDKMKNALQTVVNDNWDLRSNYFEKEGEIYLGVRDIVDADVKYIEVENQGEKQSYLEKMAYSTFNLEKDNLFRFALLRNLSDNRITLAMIFNHLIGDGIVLENIARQVETAYLNNAKPAEKGKDEVGLEVLQGYLAEEANSLLDDDDIQFWKDRLAGKELRVEFLWDREKEDEFKVIQAKRTIEGEIYQQVKEFCTAKGVSLFNFMQVIGGIIACRYSGAEEVVIGYPVNMRGKYKKLKGFCVNQLFYGFSEKGSFLEQVRKQRREWTPPRRARKVSTWDLAAIYGRQNGINVVVASSIKNKFDFAGIGGVRENDLETNIGNVDLSISYLELPAGIEITLTSVTGVASQGILEQIAGNIQLLIKKIIADVERETKNISLLNEEEYKQIIHQWNVTQRNYPKDKTIQQIFEEQAEKTPDKIALVFEEKQLTYRELNEKANKTAGAIRAYYQTNINDQLIGLYIERSLEMIIGILGILKSGGAYVPIDPSEARDRLKHKLSDANCQVILTDRKNKATLLDILEEGQLGKVAVLSLDDDWETIDQQDSNNVEHVNKSTDLAYVIYTSGSTGLPKGVMIEHYGVINLAKYLREKFDINEGTRVLQFASISFDASVYESFSALLNGGCLIISPDYTKLQETIVNRKLEVVMLTPSILTMLEKENIKSVKTLVVGAEACNQKIFEKYSEGRKFINAYGPTEITVASLMCEVTSGGKLSIGKGIANKKHYILDTNLNPVPIGVAGELYIGGDGLARGYLNKPELTAQKFILNPFSQALDSNKKLPRMYKTGDLCRWLSDGNIEFVGRVDFQVKIRGFRIELGEIEKTLLSYEGIRQAAVIAREENNSKYLVGYYTLRNQTIQAQELKEYLATKLPDYMIPAQLVSLETMPLNTSGKIDRKKLPKVDFTMDESHYVAPRNQLEEKISAIWAEVLHLSEVGINDDFFQLGGDSIRSIQLSSQLRKAGLEITVQDIFSARTIEELVKIIGQPIKTDQAKVYEKQLSYPLTQTQLGIYVECLMNPDSTLYNIPLLYALDKTVDVMNLQTAIEEAIEAHPYMKCCLDDRDGEIKQIPQDNLEYRVEIIKTTEKAFKEIKNSLVVPFDFKTAPLFRIKLYVTEEKVYFFMDIHHIIFDGFSAVVFIQSINDAYAGNGLEIETYSSFELSLEEIELRSSPEYDKAKAYYDSIFKSLEIETKLPFDQIKEAQTYEIIQEIEQELSLSQVQAYCQKLGITANSFFQGVFGYVLGKYTNQEEMVFCTIYNGRNDYRTNNIIGMLVKTLPIYCNLTDQQKVDKYLLDIKNYLLESMNHDSYSFAEISRAYQIKPDILFAYQGGEFTELNIVGQEPEQLTLQASDTKAPLSLDVFIKEGKYLLRVEYRGDLYKKATIAGLIHAYSTSLKSFLTAETLAEVNITSAKALELIESFNKTEVPIPNIPVSKLFEEQVKLHPDKIAVISCGESLTYKQLNDLANKVANSLIARGIKTEQLVGVMLPRTVNVYVARQGIVKSGAAFLPIDPQYPDDRIQYILEDSKAPYIITTEKIREQTLALFNNINCEIITIEELLSYENVENPEVDIKPHNMCYCIYTSGSTGKPKGVIIEHVNLVNYCSVNDFNAETMSYINNATVSLALAAITFDVSILEEFVPLLNGLTVCMANEEEIHNPLALAQTIIKHKVDMMTCTPSFLANIVDMEEILPALRQIKAFNVGAESFPASLYTKVNALGSNARIFNGYGPTEATIGCTFTEVVNEKITIGGPMANIKIYIMDSHGHILPAGIAGELVIAGAGVGRGYIGKPEMTKDKFIPLNGMRAYRSGDLAKWNGQGQIEFIGRIDNQVKLRGFRIELGEVENVINSYEGILSSVVLVKESSESQFLCGYFTANKEVDKEDLIRHLNNSLTYYMVPNVLVQLDKLPLTNNGKVDKKALPEPKFTKAERQYIPPTNPVERDLCEIMQNILGIEQVGITDNFFEIGGTSLSATKLAMAAMAKGYGIVYADIFKNPTPKELAAVGQTSKNKDYASHEFNNYDYNLLSSVLSKNTTTHVDQVTTTPLGNILLTGATGFLGIHILKEFLDNYPGKVYCFIRKGRAQSLEMRMKAMLMYYFENTYEDAFHDKIVMIDGDITDIDSVMALKEYPFDAIINCAACVKHFAIGTLLQDINVEGVKNLLAFCEDTGRKFIQISTSSVAGENINGSLPNSRLIHENELYFGQSITNDYVLSKFLAERAVLEAATRGVKVKIMRAGNLMSRNSDGEFQINFLTNGFMRQLKGYKVIGKYPVSAMDVPAEFSPIDSTAAAILKLAETNDEFTVFHPYNNHVIYMSDVIYAMNRYGFKIDVVKDEEFNFAFKKALKNEKINSAIAGLIAYLSNDKKNTISLIGSDNQFTTQILYRLSFKWPIPSDDYMEQSIGALDGLGFFDVE